MADCELLPKCLFFNDLMKDMPVTSEVMKRNYCRKDSSRCGRFMIALALGREKVPEDLSPSDTDRAARIIANAAR